MVTQNHGWYLSFHLIATAMATIAADISEGRARSNLPKYTNKSARGIVPIMSVRTPHHGSRIFLSFAVITARRGLCLVIGKP